VTATDQAHAAARLAADLTQLGLPPGRDLLVHCSLRQVGALEGGAATLLDAIQQVLGPAATVVVPAQTADNSTTSRAFRAATAGMDAVGRAGYEARLPGFDRLLSRSVGMGAFAEHVRTRPGAVRSAHPQASFAALGPSAATLMERHDLTDHYGEASPLATLYAADATILLVGVGYAACTALHLAEHRLRQPPPRQWYRCYTREAGRRVRHDFQAAVLDDTDFTRLGEDLDRMPFVRSGPVRAATATALPFRAAVDFAVRWMDEHRGR